MKTAFAVIAMLAFVAPAHAADLNTKMCGLAPDVQTCAAKLAICQEETAQRIENSPGGDTANFGMSITYHCLEEQNVSIPNDL